MEPIYDLGHSTNYQEDTTEEAVTMNIFFLSYYFLFDFMIFISDKKPILFI